MLQTVFYFILNMSINAVFIICAIMLIRSIRAIPKRLIYLFWAAAFVRLCLPFSLSSQWSLFNFTGSLIKRVVSVDALAAVPGLHDMTVANYIGTASSYAPVEFKTAAMREVFSAGAVIWLIVSIAAVLAMAILFRLTNTELKRATLLKGNLYSSEMLHSPVLLGVLRPRVILPASLAWDSPEAQMAIAHENVHMKRCDNLWRLLGLIVVCFHWFNPFAWILLKYFFADMELSCDEAVVGNYDAKARKAYASALLSFSEDKGMLMSAAFGKSNVKVRIVSVLNYKRLTLVGTIASALFLLAVAIVLITNPQLRG